MYVGHVWAESRPVQDATRSESEVPGIADICSSLGMSAILRLLHETTTWTTDDFPLSTALESDISRRQDRGKCSQTCMSPERRRMTSCQGTVSTDPKASAQGSHSWDSLGQECH